MSQHLQGGLHRRLDDYPDTSIDTSIDACLDAWTPAPPLLRGLPESLLHRLSDNQEGCLESCLRGGL